MSVPSKKATQSRNQRPVLTWEHVSKIQDHCKNERVVEHNEYDIDVAREGSTPIGQEPQSHLKYIMKLIYNEVENGRIRMRKKGEFKEDTLGIHCK